MKKIILITAIISLSISAYSQKRSDLMGPAYKNYKPWKHDSKTEVIYTSNKKENLTGPKYKNSKAWDKSNVKGHTAIVFGSERSKLTGPAYKNYKPWRKNDKKEE